MLALSVEEIVSSSINNNELMLYGLHVVSF